MSKTALQELEELEQSHREALAAIRLGAARSGTAGYTLKLVDPIMVGPAKVTELKFRPHTVREMRNKITGDAHEGDAFAASLCELTPEQFLQLSIEDWAAVQEVIKGFEMRRTAGGPARSTKTT